MAIQNERGALSVAHKEGELEARRETLQRLLLRAGIELATDERARIDACVDAVTLDQWIDNVFGAKSAADVLA
jgi:hypothetical protein